MISKHLKFSNHQIGITILLGIVMLAGNISIALYTALNVQQSSLTLVLLPTTLAGTLVLWAYYDSASTGRSLGLDQALYIFYVWPITFPLYLFMSRGFRTGGFFFLFFVGLHIFTAIAAFLVFIGIIVSKAILLTI